MNYRNFVCLSVLFTASLYGQATLNTLPSREVGQPRLSTASNAANAVTGREFNSPQAVVLDTRSSPPILYVADTGNNRVLAWRNPAGIGNAAPADLVIGQRDFHASQPQGPRAPISNTQSTGLYLPTGLAVDAEGNLYVADSGNNRILRYPRPFEQPSDLLLPDFVIGQTSFSAGSNLTPAANPPTANTLALSSGTYTSISGYIVGLAFDPSGNLWASDPVNHRVLRYPASSLASGQPSGPAADLVLGHPDTGTNTALPLTTQNRVAKGLTAVGSGFAQFNAPAGIAIDSGGRLFVADALNRVLVFAPPLSSGMSATRIMGIGASTTVTSAMTLGYPSVWQAPQGVTMFGNNPVVLDSFQNRILQYDPFDQWPAEATGAISPNAKSVLGQPDFTANGINRGQRDPSESSLYRPISAVASASELYVADTLNHRVLRFPLSGNFFSSASGVLGQDGYGFNGVNFVDGHEMNLFSGYNDSAGRIPYPFGSAVVDTRMDPPALYIADTYNNRILGYRDARRVKPGDRADLVIGQGDTDARFYRSSANHGSTTATQPNDAGLSAPTAVAVDASGNLYVADFGNSRVLRFPSPFTQPDISAIHRANLVLGQSSFTATRNTDASQRTMSGPSGIAFTVEGHLLVSDALHNRVLFFRKPDGGDFSNSMAATTVLGQPDFFSTTGGGDDGHFNWPRGISTDSDDRLYVADGANNRIAIYSRVTEASPRGTLFLVNVDTTSSRLNHPNSVYVSSRTGEVWVADGESGRVIRYPNYDRLVNSAFALTAVLANRPIGVTQDGFGNLIVTEGIHRVSMYYPYMSTSNAANYFAASTTRPISPGQYVSLFTPDSGITFTSETKVFDTVPMPESLADTQVLVNDTPCPLHFVSPGQINFVSPMNLGTSGTADIQVVRPSTGQIIAAATVPLGAASPGLFTSNGQGSGQLAALNQDDSINSSSNPIPRGQVIALFGTGQGFVPGAPADGEVPNAQLPASTHLRVFFNGTEATSEVQYHGLAPKLIGVWQINVKIPMSVPPGNSVPLVVSINDVPNSDPQKPSTRTTIAVKQ